MARQVPAAAARSANPSAQRVLDFLEPSELKLNLVSPLALTTFSVYDF